MKKESEYHDVNVTFITVKGDKFTLELDGEEWCEEHPMERACKEGSATADLCMLDGDYITIQMASIAAWSQ